MSLVPTSAPSRCQYLKLPRKLRDIIHAYVLTYDEGLICRPEEKDEYGKLTPRLQSSRKEQQPARVRVDGNEMPGDPNPLRLVCHQTRAETAGLLLKLNDIAFVRPDWWSDWMCDAFDTFYEQCSPVNRARLRKVSVPATRDPRYGGCGQPWYNLEAFRKVLHDFTLRYGHCTNMTIVLRFNYVQATHRLLGDWGIYTHKYAQHFHGSSELPPFMEHAGQHKRILAELVCIERDDVDKRIGHVEQGELPQHIRFSLLEEFPTEEVQRDVEEICDNAEDPYLPCRCKEYVAMAKKVFDEGA